MNFTTVFLKMMELFFVILLGYVANKTNIFDRETRVRVSKVVINLTLPATILASVLAQDNLPGAKQILVLIIVAALSYVILFASAFIVPKLLGVSMSQQGIYRFMLAFGNVGFIGYPVTEAIFGSQSVFYTSVFNIPFNLFVYSVGVAFLTKQVDTAQTIECKDETVSKYNKDQKDHKDQKIRISWKTFVTPCMISSVIALIFAFVHVRTPEIIGNTCTMIGAITTPAALMIIGSSLADMPFYKMFNNIRVYLFSIIRLIVVPLITYFIFGWFVKDQLLLGTCVIIAAMPVASNGTMLCLQYHADEELMAQGTFLTTLMSLVTIPLLAMLFI